MARRSRVITIGECKIEEPLAAVPKPSCSPRLKLTDLQKLEPLTANQKAFFDAYDRGDYFVAMHGTAGTGKTAISLYKSLEEILTRGSFFKKIVIIRSAVSGRDLGHLPGTLDDKVDVYKAPYKDLCAFLFGRVDAWDRLEETKRIELMTTSYIRGISIVDSIIIVDECQNCNYSELRTILTRVGHQSKIIFCGDYRQTDLYRNRNDMSGIKRFLDIANTMPSHTRIEFTADDIVRSSLCKEWIMAEAAYEDKEWDHEQAIIEYQKTKGM
jgi:predicted ribonuclease YlaK